MRRLRARSECPLSVVSGHLLVEGREQFVRQCRHWHIAKHRRLKWRRCFDEMLTFRHFRRGGSNSENLRKRSSKRPQHLRLQVLLIMKSPVSVAGCSALLFLQKRQRLRLAAAFLVILEEDNRWQFHLPRETVFVMSRG